MTPHASVNALAQRRPLAVYMAAATTVLFWSGTPIANKIAIGSIDAATAGLLRSALAGLMAVPVALTFKLPFPAGGRRRVLLIVSGICNFALWPLLLSLGLRLTTANHAALIIAMIPVATGLVAAAVDRAWPKRSWWLGVSIAAAGTFSLISFRGGSAATDGATPTGDFLILVGIVVALSAMSPAAGSRR